METYISRINNHPTWKKKGHAAISLNKDQTLVWRNATSAIDSLLSNGMQKTGWKSDPLCLFIAKGENPLDCRVLCWLSFQICRLQISLWINVNRFSFYPSITKIALRDWWEFPSMTSSKSIEQSGEKVRKRHDGRLTFVVSRRLQMALTSQVKPRPFLLLRLEGLGRRRRRCSHESRRCRRIPEMIEATGRQDERRRRRWPLPGHLRQSAHRLRIAQLAQIRHPLHEIDGRYLSASIVAVVG